MKINKLTYGLMAASVLSLASCNLNDYPEFDNANAFVAIQQSSASIAETGEELSIPVMLTSLGGLQGSVDFEITPDSEAGAQEGVHFTVLNASKTLTFTAEEPTQYIKLKIIDNDEFGGDIYKRDGSHGCINTPYDPMERLYELTEVGTPVVMFY